MGAQLRSVEVYYSYADERLHIHLPPTLAPIIGKHGRLRCRLEGVRRPNDTEPRACNDEFDTEFGNDRRLIIPSDLANRRGVVGGSALTLTIEARLVEERGFFRKRNVVESVFPNDTVQFDAAESTSYRYAAPSFGRGPMGWSDREDLSFLPPATRGLGAPAQGQPGSFHGEAAAAAEQPTLVLSPSVATMIPSEDAAAPIAPPVAAASPSVLAALDVLAQAVAGNRSPSAWATAAAQQAAAQQAATPSPAPSPAPVVTVIPPPRAATRPGRKSASARAVAATAVEDVAPEAAAAAPPPRTETRKTKAAADPAKVAKPPREVVEPAPTVLAQPASSAFVELAPPPSNVAATMPAADAAVDGAGVVAFDPPDVASPSAPAPTEDPEARSVETLARTDETSTRVPCATVAADVAAPDADQTPETRGRARAKGRSRPRAVARERRWSVDPAEAPQPDIQGAAYVGAHARYDGALALAESAAPLHPDAATIAPSLAAAYPDIVAAAEASDDPESADRRRWLETLELYRAAKGGRLIVNKNPAPRPLDTVGAD